MVFDGIIYFVILCNIVLVIWEVVIESKKCGEELAKYTDVFHIINYVFIGVYIIEMVVKVSTYMSLFVLKCYSLVLLFFVW